MASISGIAAVSLYFNYRTQQAHGIDMGRSGSLRTTQWVS